MKRKNIRKKVVTAILTAAMMCSLTACSSEPANQETSGTGNAGTDVLKVGYVQEPSSFDPADFTNVAAVMTGYDCYDTLLNFTADGTDVEAGLADSWEQVDDVTYTYHIREGVKFSDGNELTMEDVLYSLNRVTEKGYYMGYLFAGVDSFSVDEAGRTLTVKLKQPDSTWKYIPATSACCIIEKSVAEQAGDSYGSSAETTAGTGPYKLVSWESGSEIVLEKNEYWWGGADTLALNSIEYYIIEDESSLAMAAKGGQVDFVQGFSNDVKSVYDSIPDMTIQTCDGTNVYYVALDTSAEPFNDVYARKALASCIDTAEITSVVGGVFSTQSPVAVLPESMEYMDKDLWSDTISSSESYTKDYDKAAEYLAQSAYPDGFTFDYYCTSNNVKLAELLKSQIDSSGMITMNIVEVPASDIFSYMYGYNLDEDGTRCYNAVGTYWMSDFLDPIGVFSPLYGSSSIGEGGTNMALWSNEEADSLLAAATAADDDAGKMDSYTKAYAVFAEEVPYIGLYALQDSYALNNKFSYTPSPMFWYNFTYADFSVN